jgi:hypothetical protein
MLVRFRVTMLVRLRVWYEVTLTTCADAGLVPVAVLPPPAGAVELAVVVVEEDFFQGDHMRTMIPMATTGMAIFAHRGSFSYHSNISFPLLFLE